MTLRRHNSQHLLAAWLCLFAALCLYAPLAVSAWPASQSCCASGLCAMPEHHHRDADSHSGSSSHCAHHSAGMAGCNMSCCDQQELGPISPVAYVLPASVSLASLDLLARHLPAAPRNKLFVSLDTLYPPPKA